LSIENRQAQRQKVLKSAKIVLDDWTAIDCTVRDVSQTGARLVCDNTINLPPKFKLFMVSDRTIRDVTAMWRKPSLIGVRFDSEPKSAGLRKF